MEGLIKIEPKKFFYQALHASPQLLIFEVEPGQGNVRRRAKGKEEIKKLLEDLVEYSKDSLLGIAQGRQESANWFKDRANNGHQLE
ncbi:MAG: hypothetical protein Q8N88_01645 [Nanoarchaeota archaeon]|nr:hypothetical protein [Nanoarchaeota archaeon]